MVASNAERILLLRVTADVDTASGQMAGLRDSVRGAGDDVAKLNELVAGLRDTASSPLQLRADDQLTPVLNRADQSLANFKEQADAEPVPLRATDDVTPVVASAEDKYASFRADLDKPVQLHIDDGDLASMLNTDAEAATNVGTKLEEAAGQARTYSEASASAAAGSEESAGAARTEGDAAANLAEAFQNLLAARKEVADATQQVAEASKAAGSGEEAEVGQADQLASALERLQTARDQEVFAASDVADAYNKLNPAYELTGRNAEAMAASVERETAAHSAGVQVLSQSVAGHDELGRSVSTTTKYLDDNRASVTASITGYNELGDRVTITAAAEGEAGTAAEEAAVKLQEAAAGLSAADSGGESFTGTLRTMAYAFFDVQMAAMLVKQVVSTIWDAAIAPAAEYQQTLERIQANTNLTAQDMQNVSTQTLQMAQSTSAPINDLANGYMRLANEGFDVADSTKIMTAAQQLAVGTGSQVAQTVNIVGVAMHDYKLPADEATQTTNTLLAAVRLGNTTMSEFASPLQRLTPIASQLGISFTDLTAMIATLTSEGVPASQVYSQLMNTMVRMTEPTTAQTKELEALSKATGVDLVSAWSAANIAAGGFDKAVTETHDALAQSDTEVQKLEPNMRGLTGGIALLGEGYDNWKANIDKVNQATADSTSVQSAFDAEMHTEQGAAGELGNALHAWQIQMSQGNLPAIIDLENALTGLLQKETEYLTVLPQEAGGLQGIAASTVEAYANTDRLAIAGANWSDIQGVLILRASALRDNISAQAEAQKLLQQAQDAQTQAQNANTDATGRAEAEYTGLAAHLATGATSALQLGSSVDDLTNHLSTGTTVESGFVDETVALQGAADKAATALDGLNTNTEKYLDTAAKAIGAISDQTHEYGLLAGALDSIGAAMKAIPTDKQLETDAANNATKAYGLETQALVADSEGHTSLAAALRAEEATYGGVNDAALTGTQLSQLSAERAVTLAQANDKTTSSTSNSANAYKAETAAQTDNIKGKQDLVVAEQALSAAYASGNKDQIEAAQRNLALATAQDSLVTSSNSSAAAQIKDADSIDKAYQTLTDNTTKNTALITGSYLTKHVASQQSIADEEAEGAAAQSSAEQAWAAYQGYTQQYLDALQRRSAALAAGDSQSATVYGDEATRLSSLASDSQDAWNKSTTAAEGYYKTAQSDSDAWANQVQSDADKAQSALLGMFTKPTAEELKVKAAIADLTDQISQLQLKAGDETAAQKFVAGFQAAYDKAVETGASLQDVQKAKTALDSALGQTGPAGASASALQSNIDKLTEQKTQLGLSETALSSHREALGADASASDASAVSMGTLTQAVPLATQVYQEHKATGLDPTGAAYRGLDTDVSTAMTTVSQTVPNTITVAGTALQTHVSSAVQPTGDAYSSLAQTVPGNVSDIQAAVTAYTSTVGPALQAHVTNDITPVGVAYGQMQTDTTDAAQGMANNIPPLMTTVGAGVSDPMNTAQQNVSTSMSTLATNVNTVLTDLEPKANSEAQAIGSGIDAGITTGIESGIPALEQAARDAVERAIVAGKAQAQTGSPSKVAAEQIGQPIAAGIAQGITDNQSLVTNAVNGVVQSAMATGQSAASQSTSGRTPGGATPTYTGGGYHQWEGWIGVDGPVDGPASGGNYYNVFTGAVTGSGASLASQAGNYPTPNNAAPASGVIRSGVIPTYTSGGGGGTPASGSGSGSSNPLPAVGSGQPGSMMPGMYYPGLGQLPPYPYYADPANYGYPPDRGQYQNGTSTHYYDPTLGYAEGLWNVPADMTANVHQGEMIAPPDFASQLRSALGSGGGSGSGGDIHVHLDLRGAVVSSDAAVRDLSDLISKQVYRQLLQQNRVGPRGA